MDSSFSLIAIEVEALSVVFGALAVSHKAAAASSTSTPATGHLVQSRPRPPRRSPTLGQFHRPARPPITFLNLAFGADQARRLRACVAVCGAAGVVAAPFNEPLIASVPPLLAAPVMKDKDASRHCVSRTIFANKACGLAPDVRPGSRLLFRTNWNRQVKRGQPAVCARTGIGCR